MLKKPVASPGREVRSAGKAKEPGADERAMLIMLYSQGLFQDAAGVALSMTKAFPKHGLAWKVLGAALKKQGRTDEALAPTQKATQLMPRDHEAFNNLGVIWKDLGRPDSAISCYQHALGLKPDYPDALGNLGDALRNQGKLDEALRSYQQKQVLVPDDGETQHHIAALAGLQTERAPERYVAGVFDAYADSFDQHLQGALKYDTPRHLTALLKPHLTRPDHQWDVLDLGCGTGLMGEQLAPHAKYLVGVDLSSRMLDNARLKNVYQRLEHADIIAMMQAEPAQRYDLVAATDVFVYLGKLQPVFEEARRLLSAGGLFAFSVESISDAEQAAGSGEAPGYRLAKSGRYAHTERYIRQMASLHGFAIEAIEPTDIRLDDQKPIRGWLVVLVLQ